MHHAAGQTGGPGAERTATGSASNGAPAEAAWNPTPADIVGPDRAAIDEELEAAMDMTPPGRRVRIELMSGSTLLLSVSPYEPGPDGADCRVFEYEYRPSTVGRARVTGRRCWRPETGWRPTRMDDLVEADGLPAIATTAPLEPAGRGPGTDGAIARSRASSDSASTGAVRRSAGTPDTAAPKPADSAPPPSRVILPFVLDETRPASRP